MCWIRKPRLLVLDSSNYQRLFRAILGEEYELIATDDPGEAVRLASSGEPDLILLSASVEGEGVFVASEIRGATSVSTPILLMLTTDQPTLRREAEKAGCNGFLIKPVDPDRLKSQIEGCLKGQPQ